MNRRLGLLTSAIALAAAVPALAEQTFNRIASFPVTKNMAAGEDTARATSAEIISASEDGMTLVYSDSPLGVLGFVDITDPRDPKPLGNVAMDGEPTTAVIIGDKVFVGVDTSDSFTAPSGALRMIDLKTEQVVTSCDLGGQPDSVAKAKDDSFLAVAIENQRDEDVNDGALPQMPAGYVVKLPLKGGAVDCAAMQKIEMTGLAEIAPEDPEPEFVDINDAGEIVVSLQENNHIVVIGADGKVASHFSAGTVSLEGIDTKSDGKLDFTGKKDDVAREPDGVQWIGTDLIATANEGDWQGGSRGWTLFDRSGKVVYEDAGKLERAIAEMGHFPDKRAKSKGVELESVEYGLYGDTPVLFVVSERASVIGVYDISEPAQPQLLQILPSGVSPEGAIAIPARNLLASANEADLGEDGGARAHVMLYERAEGPAAYPMITSAGAAEPIGWGALSGLVADATTPGKLYAISDSFYAMQPAIFEIDATRTPARIVKKTVVTRGGQPAQKLDLEGITLDGEGGFWLASEGNTAKLVPHALYHVDAKGEIKDEVALPQALAGSETRFGFEGVAKVGNRLWMAVQREWADDAKGQVKLLSYDLDSKEWGAAAYPLEPKGEGWMGLSELTVHGDLAYVIERDNLLGDAAKVKKIFSVPLADLTPVKLGEPLPVVAKTEVRDLIPELKSATNGYVLDKVEGFAIDAAGTGFVVTDNDGVDDSSGETLFWSVGAMVPASN
ncbi:esterase-like activity of phytase family protein [Frigidibacter sp. MR17.14]|uniref:esterase-like activity of phytase family protein n=1 Tax=Frigidibacter sp. MR17.14 TaxID=3126509 RepID=UPI0030131ABC